MRILLTGANGHLGANTARELVKQGHEVVAFVRQTSDLRSLDGVEKELAYGDVTDATAVAEAADGCDAIIHTATVFAYWAKDPAIIEETAVNGAKAVVEAARRAGVDRLVYTSSGWAIGLSDDPNTLRTAADWNDQPHSYYARAKTISEQLAWEEADKAGVPMIALCPGALFGPLDYKPTPSNRMLLEMADGSGQTVNAGLAYADIRDAAAIHALAVAHGEVGKRYAVCQSIHFRELGKAITGQTGKKVKHFGAPKPIGRLVGSMMEVGARFTGKEPAITRGLIEDSTDRYMYIDCEPTWQTFQYRPYPLSETLRDSLAWYRQMEWL